MLLPSLAWASAADSTETARAANDKTGVTDSTVSIGISLPLSGQYRPRNLPVEHAVEAYSSYINDQGGINGRRLEFVLCNDEYDDQKSVDCFNSKFRGKVLALGFLSGSGSIIKYLSLADPLNMPVLGFVTGTPITHEFRKNVFVLRRSFVDEVNEEVNYLVKVEHKRRIASLCGTDTFTGGLHADIEKAVAANGLTPVAMASYSRDKNDVEPGLQSIMDANPDAVILGAHSFSILPSLQFKKAHNWQVEFAGVSSQNDALIRAGSLADGFLLPQVAPSIDDPSPATAKYTSILKKYFPDDSPAMSGYEAYLNAVVMVEGLKKAGKNLTRTSFEKGLESLHNFDIGAGPRYKVNFSSSNHEGWSVKSIVMTRMKNGVPIPVSAK